MSRVEQLHWKVGLKGRRWSSDEIELRWRLIPEKFECLSGEFLEDGQRLDLLTMLLEQVGVQRAVTLAPRSLWKLALDHYDAGGEIEPVKPKVGERG